MLTKITILTCFIFAVMYPLCFWVSFKDPLKNKFHKFNLGLPNVIGGVVLVVILFSGLPNYIKIATAVWKITLLSVSRFYWKKEYPSPFILTVPCVVGLFAYFSLQDHIVSTSYIIRFITILAGGIFCLAFFTMNLGHFYLNVHGLPMKHLKNATDIFWGLLIARAVIDIYIVLTGKILYLGDSISLGAFMMQLDGFLLFIAVFFGTAFPIVAMYFVSEILKIKNTQAATGILYVVLCSVLIGDLTYKYYFIKYGIIL